MTRIREKFTFNNKIDYVLYRTMDGICVMNSNYLPENAIHIGASKYCEGLEEYHSPDYYKVSGGTL